MKRSIIETGRTRTIGGTQFPETFQVYKIGRVWICASVCNGIADYAKEFKTKTAALKYAAQN